MRLLDIHTHNTCTDSTDSILCSSVFIPERNISIGIHPWNITEEWKSFFTEIREHAQKENVIIIGECGIDRLKSPATLTLQKEIFKAHALLAEEVKKPLIIHCVKGYDDILSVRKEIAPTQAWIIHGFRGKPQQAEQLTKAGVYLSYGEKFNDDSLRATPLEMLFVETDESTTGVEDIYSLIAKKKGVEMRELALQVIQNAENCGIYL